MSALAKASPILLALLKRGGLTAKLTKQVVKHPWKSGFTAAGAGLSAMTLPSIADDVGGLMGFDLSGERGRVGQMARAQGVGSLLDDLDTSYDLLREEEIARATRPFLGIDGDPFDAMPMAGAREASSQSQFQSALAARQGELARLSVVDQGDTSFEELALRMGI